MPNPGKSIFIFVCVWALSVVGQTARAQAVVQVNLNSDVITIDDTATLQILTDSTSSDVDFSSLSKDFDVIARSNSQQVQISNGQERVIQAWVLELAPKEVGIFTLSGIKVGNVESDPVQLTVTEATAGGARVLFLTAEVDKSEVFVQEQVILTIKVHEATQIFDQQITSLRHDDLVIHNIGSEAVTEQVIDGQRYRVRSQRFALFPQKSGEIEIPQLLLSASIPKDDKAVQGFFRDSKWIKRRTPAITLNVKPRPDEQNAAWWLPALDVSMLNRWTPRTAVVEVTESANEGQLAGIAKNNANAQSEQASVSEFNSGTTTLRVDINQPITRVIKIAGKGVGSNQLPDIELPVVDGLDLYAEDVASTSREVAHGMDTIQDITWAIVPQRPGTFELPEVSVEWFNTTTGKTEFAVLPPQIIEVVGEANANAVAAEPGNDPSADQQTDGVQNGSLAKDVNDESAEAAHTDNAVSAVAFTQGGRSTVWKWLALAALLGWIATVAGFVVWRKKWQSSTGEKMPNIDVQKKPDIKPEQPMQELKRALQQRDPGNALQNLLLWGECVWPDNPPRHIHEISSRLPADELKSVLQNLDAELYQGRGGDSISRWDVLDTLPQLLEQALVTEQSRIANQQSLPDGLPSL